MKRILKYLFAVMTCGAVLASCDINKPDIFDDANAFVAFDKASMAVDETYSAEGAVLKVPVTLASVAGIEEKVSFKVVDGTAKAGTHFECLNTTGVLTFTAEERTQYIEFEIINYPYYTGDLSFTIEFVETNSVSQGAENTCKVTIRDLDHPLAALFGTYTVSGESVWGGTASWPVDAYKDPDDDTKIWFLNLVGAANGFERIFDSYGIVDADMTTITIPFGQAATLDYYNEEGDLLLLGFDGSSGHDVGSMTLNIIKDDNGNVTGLDFGSEWGLWAYVNNVGNLAIWLPGSMTAVKN